MAIRLIARTAVVVAAWQNYVETAGTGYASIYASLTVEFFPTVTGGAFVSHQGISQTGINIRGNPVVVGQRTINAPSSGTVVVRFDGDCISSVGDRIVLAASDTADWTPNDGNVTVRAASSNVETNSFSHTRAYSVGAGSHTYYAVAQNYVETRSIRRFRGRAILVHWLHAASFALMLVTGAIMFYDLTGMDGGRMVRTIHKGCAVTFVAVPALFSLIDPLAALGFLKEAFLWDRDDLAWLRSSASFYFGRRTEMPRQGYLNGDQRLWQLVTAVTGMAFAASGLLMWFFKLKMSVGLYQGILLAHAISFALAAALFVWQLYVTLVHPRFEESPSAMVDGKVSPIFARERYAKWFERVSPAARRARTAGVTGAAAMGEGYRMSRFRQEQAP